MDALVHTYDGHDIWSADDEAAYRKFRRELWATWQPRDWS